ncbi:hypothetical protein ECG_03968 [Echinococcus granulosus]|nr:hypothetical protein ECG_03968 [Echinococcus granulosus]
MSNGQGTSSYLVAPTSQSILKCLFVDYCLRFQQNATSGELRMAPKAVRRQAESAVPTPSGAGFKPTPPHTQKRRLTHWVSSAERARGQASQQAGEEGGWGNSGGGGGWSLLPTDRLPPLAPV